MKKALILIIAITSIILAIVYAYFMNQSKYVVLTTNLSVEEICAITKALDHESISWKANESAGEIQVLNNEVEQARRCIERLEN